MSSQTIPITEKDIKDYLDRVIDSWRKARDERNSEIARYYIDAFQSVRISFFGELKDASKTA